MCTQHERGHDAQRPSDPAICAAAHAPHLHPAIQASITPVRVVCANTLNLALGSKRGKNAIKQSFKIRHTQTANGKVQIARETLGLANKYMDEFDKLTDP